MKLSIGWVLLALAAVAVYMYRDRLFGSGRLLNASGGTQSNNPVATTGGSIGRDVSEAAAGIAGAVASIFNRVQSSAQTAPNTI